MARSPARTPDTHLFVVALTLLVCAAAVQNVANASMQERRTARQEQQPLALLLKMKLFSTEKIEALQTLEIVRQELDGTHGDLQLRKRKAFCLYMLDETDLAISELESVLHDHREDTQTAELLAAVYHWKATLHLRSGNAASALRLIERALTLLPGEPYFKQLKAEALAMRGRQD